MRPSITNIFGITGAYSSPVHKQVSFKPFWINVELVLDGVSLATQQQVFKTVSVKENSPSISGEIVGALAQLSQRLYSCLPDAGKFFARDDPDSLPELLPSREISVKEA